MALESMEDGYIAKIVVPSGAQDIQVGEVVAVMVEEAVDCAKFADYVPAAGSRPPPPPPPPPRPPHPRRPRCLQPLPPRLRLRLPRGLRRARGLRQPPGARDGEGGGRRDRTRPRHRRASNSVVMSDVARAIESGVAVGGASGAAGAGAADGFARFFPPFEDVSLTTIKKVTAARLTESKQAVPHFYLAVGVRMDKLASLRAQLNAGLEKSGGKIATSSSRRPRRR